MQEINFINRPIFYFLALTLYNEGLDSDRINFRELRKFLYKPYKLNLFEFFTEIVYIICLAGFRQELAKQKADLVVDFITKYPDFSREKLLEVYTNEKKINAIIKVWENRELFYNDFYSKDTIDNRINTLNLIPYIGDRNKYHLARNLGFDVVKYDIFVQKLSILLYCKDSNKEQLFLKASNTKLNEEIKKFCAITIQNIQDEVKEKASFIDLVLYKACHVGILQIKDNKVFLNRNFFKIKDF